MIEKCFEDFFKLMDLRERMGEGEKACVPLIYAFVVPLIYAFSG